MDFIAQLDRPLRRTVRGIGGPQPAALLRLMVSGLSGTDLMLLEDQARSGRSVRVILMDAEARVTVHNDRVPLDPRLDAIASAAPQGAASEPRPAPNAEEPPSEVTAPAAEPSFAEELLKVVLQTERNRDKEEVDESEYSSGHPLAKAPTTAPQESASEEIDRYLREMEDDPAEGATQEEMDGAHGEPVGPSGEIVAKLAANLVGEAIVDHLTGEPTPCPMCQGPNSAASRGILTVEHVEGGTRRSRHCVECHRELEPPLFTPTGGLPTPEPEAVTRGRRRKHEG